MEDLLGTNTLLHVSSLSVVSHLLHDQNENSILCCVPAEQIRQGLPRAHAEDSRASVDSVGGVQLLISDSCLRSGRGEGSVLGGRVYYFRFSVPVSEKLSSFPRS